MNPILVLKIMKKNNRTNKTVEKTTLLNNKQSCPKCKEYNDSIKLLDYYNTKIFTIAKSTIVGFFFFQE